MQALDGLLTIYITGEYDKKHLDSLREKFPVMRLTKFNRKIRDETVTLKNIIDNILDADIVIAIYSSYDRNRYNDFDFEIGYAKALNRRILVVNTNESYECGTFAEAAADYNPKSWEEALSILVSLTYLATSTP